MGCVKNKPQDQTKTGIQYVPPGPATTQTTSYQPPSQQSLRGNTGPQNGSVGYNSGLPNARSTSPEDDGSIFITRYAYQARTAEDLSFEKGEKLRVNPSLYFVDTRHDAVCVCACAVEPVVGISWYAACCIHVYNSSCYGDEFLAGFIKYNIPTTTKEAYFN